MILTQGAIILQVKTGAHYVRIARTPVTSYLTIGDALRGTETSENITKEEAIAAFKSALTVIVLSST